MSLNLTEAREFLAFAVEALGRYKLRTSLSVLGVVLGVASVIAMMSVSEGAGREALAQVEALGLDNLVARSLTNSAHGGLVRGLAAGDADRAEALVGIMNIMLTSVVERTREIGVRRTVGATRRDVTLQFLIEALMMTVGGGALGIAIGVGISFGISVFAGWATHVSPLAVLLGFIVSCGVGLVCGLYPAIKAARLEPVDAMRYE